MNFTNPKYFNSRESSWVDFNLRVLDEARDQKNPLLERLRFLGISQDNLDEFFNVRVATLLKKIKENAPADMAGHTPENQLETVLKKTQRLVNEQGRILNRLVLPAMQKHGIGLLKWRALTPDQKAALAQYFEEDILPNINSILVNNSKTLPFLANDSINFIARFNGRTLRSTVIIPLPEECPRVLTVPGTTNEFIMLEEVMAQFLDRCFAGQRLQEWALFKITRYMDFDINDQNTKAYKQSVLKTLEDRAHGSVIRLETTVNSNMGLINWLSDCYNLRPSHVFKLKTPLELTFVNQLIAKVVDQNDLLFEKVVPYDPQVLRENAMFDNIASNDIFVHHPYDSFNPVLRFVDEAAKDESVSAIKMTLYRVSKNSPIISSLLLAAQNGKQVTIMLELKARADEANNLKWADELEAAGCTVLYGIPGLKVHSKLCLITRIENDQKKYYTHLATGNYNDKTAKLYTDMGLFTANQEIGEDADKIFAFISGETAQPELKQLSISPNNIRTDLMKQIDQEIENAKNGLPSGIKMKMNSLSDRVMIQKLFEANAAGVKTDLIIRGICNLQAGIPGVSDHITVHSIVGRLLEHSRIFIFENAGKPKVFLSSADLMKRNLSRRVEILFPVLNPVLKESVQKIFNQFLRDDVKARMLKRHHRWIKLSKRRQTGYNVQNDLIKQQVELADERLKATGLMEQEKQL